jgi:hypothetical protein
MPSENRKRRAPDDAGAGGSREVLGGPYPNPNLILKDPRCQKLPLQDGELVVVGQVWYIITLYLSTCRSSDSSSAAATAVITAAAAAPPPPPPPAAAACCMRATVVLPLHLT